MFQFLLNLKLKNLILVAVIFFSVTIFAFTIIYLSVNVSKKTKENSMQIVDRHTHSYAVDIQGRFNQVVSVTRTLAETFLETRDTDIQTLNPSSKNILINVLSANPEFISVWFDWEINVIDPTYDKKNGRVANIAFREGDNFVVERVIMDTTNQEIEGDYYFIKKTKKEVMGEPYYDEITASLKGILMVSPGVPIIIDNQFAGMVGIDLDMREVQKIVQSIKPFKQSQAYLVSPLNKVVAHTNEKNHNKALHEIYPDHKKELEEAFVQINQNKPFSFVYKNDKSAEIYVSIFPLVIGRDNEIWALATETPLKEIVAESNSIFTWTLFIGFLGIILLCVAIYFILDRIIAKLNIAVNLSEKISQGDLSSRIEVTGNNEIAILGKSLNSMADKLKNIVADISKAASNINSTSREIDDYSLDIAQNASNQAASVEEVMASIEEMTSNIYSTSDNAKETEIIADKTFKGINLGTKSSLDTVNSINKIAENIAIIREISHQTNILSLNAAVEAARAGIHGKGFAVVANEVKKLAEKAQTATKQITTLASEGVKISKLAEKELSDLLPDIEKTAGLIREIANASLEQSHGATQIQNVIQELNNIAQKNAMHSEQLNSKAKNLTGQANQLKKMIGFFKL